MQPTVESKTPFPISPEGVQMPFGPGVLYEVDSSVKDMAQEKIKYLVEENARLRLEIKALKRIVKNVRN